MPAGSQLSMIGSPPAALKDFPALRDAPPAKREAFIIQKLQLCGVIFSFDDPTADKRGKDMKRQTLLELVDYVNTCLDSDHFQVVERALFLWNNEHLVNSGCLSRLNAQAVLPIIYGPLYKNSSGHWNATVEGLAQNVLKMYMEYDLVLYDKCTTAYFKEEEEAKRKVAAVADRWTQIEAMAAENNERRGKNTAILVTADG